MLTRRDRFRNSTTLAARLNEINEAKACRVVTRSNIPVEFVHPHSDFQPSAQGIDFDLFANGLAKQYAESAKPGDSRRRNARPGDGKNRV